jgi:hypothetical protein
MQTTGVYRNAPIVFGTGADVMPLFVCSKCKAVENTAVGAYWGKDESLCSECDEGKWHGHFKKRTIKSTQGDDDPLVLAVDGFVYHRSELAPGGYFHGKTRAVE